MAVQEMNIVRTAECDFVHLSEIDTNLAAGAASRNRKRRAVCNNCSFGRTAVAYVGVVCKACVWLPITTEAGVYRSALN